jgi:uncharacterized protein YndB with AHSA1/START domain
MSSRSRHVHATPEKVWEVLSDGWLYPLWVVGATRMRAVDEDWPAPGAQLHHSAGVWPLVVDDTTEVLEATAAQSLVLRARGWPAGEAQVVIELAAEGTGTRLVIREDAVRGPGRLVPPPVRHPLIAIRNTEALRRLAALAEGR